MQYPIDANNQPSPQPFETWNQDICDNFCVMQLEPPKKSASFHGYMRKQNLERTSMSVVSSTPVFVSRHRKHISQAEQAFFLLKIQLEGTGVIRQYGNEAFLQPGDFTLCSSTEPYELYFPEYYRQAVLSIPQGLLRELIYNPERFLGCRQRSQVAANGVFVQFATSVLAKADLMSPELTNRLESNILDVLVTALEMGQEKSSENGIRTEYLYRIKQFIHAHLQDPELDPDKIADALGISKRYLHMIFKGQKTTLTKYIQHQRLESCKYCLHSQEYLHLGVSEIAFKHGFNDAAHFSRSFKQLFGKTPSEIRNCVLKGLSDE